MSKHGCWPPSRARPRRRSHPVSPGDSASSSSLLGSPSSVLLKSGCRVHFPSKNGDPLVVSVTTVLAAADNPSVALTGPPDNPSGDSATTPVNEVGTAERAHRPRPELGRAFGRSADNPGGCYYVSNVGRTPAPSERTVDLPEGFSKLDGRLRHLIEHERGRAPP